MMCPMGVPCVWRAQGFFSEPRRANRVSTKV